MKIPSDTSFLFVCAQHNIRLNGAPRLVHPNLHATAVWSFDTSDMSCSLNTDGADGNNCQLTWEARA
jgi:hypothetical protein